MRRRLNNRRFSQRRATRRSFRRRASQALEIFNFPGSNADLEKASGKVWPDVTYNGQNIVDFIMKYSNLIRSRFENPHAQKEGEYTWMQECYGGYDIKSDTYYMGFDTAYLEYVDYEEEDEYGDITIEEGVEEVPGWAIFKIKNRKVDLVDEGVGNFYFEGYKAAKRLRLAGLRWD